MRCSWVVTTALVHVKPKSGSLLLWVFRVAVYQKPNLIFVGFPCLKGFLHGVPFPVSNILPSEEGGNSESEGLASMIGFADRRKSSQWPMAKMSG